MKSITRTVDLVIFILIGIILTACSSSLTTSYVPQGNEGVQGSSPMNGGAQLNTTNQTYHFDISSSPSVPPSDVMEQVSWEGQGGGSGNDSTCTQYCVKSTTDDTVVFSNFGLNQELKVDIYRWQGANLNNYYVAPFFGEMNIQADSTGSLTLVFDINLTFSDILIVRDGSGSILVEYPTGVEDTNNIK